MISVPYFHIVNRNVAFSYIFVSVKNKYAIQIQNKYL